MAIGLPCAESKISTLRERRDQLTIGNGDFAVETSGCILYDCASTPLTLLLNGHFIASIIIAEGNGWASIEQRNIGIADLITAESAHILRHNRILLDTVGADARVDQVARQAADSTDVNNT